MPNDSMSSHRLSRCRSSSRTHSRSPLRTRSIAGWYIPRQASANASQSASTPRRPPSARPSRMMLDRQSTTVPNTSKTRASTFIESATISLSSFARRSPRPARVRRCDAKPRDSPGAACRAPVVASASPVNGPNTPKPPSLCRAPPCAPDGADQRERSFGSSRSRRASPKRLNPNTARVMASPGKIESHGALSRNSSAPPLSISPHAGVGSCTPMPR